MTMDTESGSAHPVEPPLKRSDKFFILFMICMVCIVTWVGYLSYQKGQLEETTKRNGEAWLQWLSEAATHRHEAGFQPEACAAQLPPTSQRWQNCYQSLTAADGPLGPQRNPFSGRQVQRAVKCDSQDRQLAGSLVFEKITPTPPGSAIPTLMTALLDNDSIGEKIQIRISVCDSGSNPIRIGELEF